MTAMPRFLFAIRDDDTSYYTHPEELAAVYKGIWDTVPVSLSVIPFSTPFKNGYFMRNDLKSEPLKALEENQELVSFLHELLEKQKIEIMLHGYSHEYKNINGKWVPECLWKPTQQLEIEIPEGKKYLEELLATRIEVFVPPSNRITRFGIEIIEREGLNLSGIMGPFGDRPLSLGYLKAWWRRWNWWFRYGRPYPYVLEVGKHKELVAYSLTPSTDWYEIKRTLKFCAQINAPFVVATHYWEVGKSPDLRDKLYQLVYLALKYGANPVKISSCYDLQGGKMR